MSSFREEKRSSFNASSSHLRFRLPLRHDRPLFAYDQLQARQTGLHVNLTDYLVKSYLNLEVDVN